MWQSTLDLLSMRAFHPDARNFKLPFGRRNINESLLGIGMHYSGVSLCCLNRIDGAREYSLSSITSLIGLDDEALHESIMQYARKHYLRYAIGLLSYEFTIEQRKLVERQGNEDSELLRNDPIAVLGNDVENGHRYSVVRHPNDRSNAVVFAYKLSAIKRLEMLSIRSPITFLQIGGGIEWALQHWLDTSLDKASSRPLDLVIYDYPTITIFQIDNRTFSPNIFCRTDSSGVLPRESAIVRKGLERYLRSGSRVSFVDLSLAYQGEAIDEGLGGLLREVVGVEDLTIEPFKHSLQLLLEENKL